MYRPHGRLAWIKCTEHKLCVFEYWWNQFISHGLCVSTKEWACRRFSSNDFSNIVLAFVVRYATNCHLKPYTRTGCPNLSSLWRCGWMTRTSAYFLPMNIAMIEVQSVLCCAYMMHVHREFVLRFKHIRRSLILYSYGFWNENEILSFPFLINELPMEDFFSIEINKSNDEDFYHICMGNVENGTMLFMTSISDALLFEKLLFFISLSSSFFEVDPFDPLSIMHFLFIIHGCARILSFKSWNWHFFSQFNSKKINATPAQPHPRA